jgi:hypothetical protein
MDGQAREITRMALKVKLLSCMYLKELLYHLQTAQFLLT